MVDPTASGVFLSHRRLTAIVAIEGRLREHVARTVVRRIVASVKTNQSLAPVGRSQALPLVIATEDPNVANVALELGVASVVVVRTPGSVGRFELVTRALEIAEARFGASSRVVILGADLGPQHAGLIDSMLEQTIRDDLDSLVVTRTRRLAALVQGSMRPSFLVFELASVTRAEFIRCGEYVGPRLATCDAPDAASVA